MWGGREFHREMVPRHGEYLVSTGDFRVCTYVVMFRNVHVCFHMRNRVCVQVCSCAHTGKWKRREISLDVEESGSDACATRRSRTRPALTFEAVIQLIQLAVFRLPLPENQVVCDVAVGVRGRLPLQDNLG